MITELLLKGASILEGIDGIEIVDANRMRVEEYASTGQSIWYYDDVPMIRFFPIEVRSQPPASAGDNYKITASRKYQILVPKGYVHGK